MTAEKPVKPGPSAISDAHDARQRARQHSSDLIYETMMRGGGEPFGVPFSRGIASLTEKVVAVFRQRGFFAFETLEKLLPPNRRNKFTRQGASRFRGAYRRPAKMP